MSETEKVEEWEAVELIRSLVPAGPEAINRRVAILRGIAGQARESTAARRIIVRLLDIVADGLPDEAATFRIVYLDGQRQSARQTGRALCMDKRTVQRHTHRVLEAMLAPAFGVYGVFLTEREREEQEPLEEVRYDQI